MLIQFLIIAAFLLSFAIPFGGFLLSKRKVKNFKISLACNIFLVICTIVTFTVLTFSGSVSAAETSEATNNSADGMKYLGAALSTGLACIGAGFAVSGAASSAIGAISEDSSLMGKSLIFVALAEGIAIYGLLISVMILG